MQARPTTDSESSLLATPRASEGAGGALPEDEVLRRGNQVGIRDQAIDLAAANGLKTSRADLLPTPVTTDAAGSRNATANRSNPDSRHHSGTTLTDALLPTPAVSHLRNHDEDVDAYLQRRQDYEDGKTLGMPGASLGVAVRLVEAGVDWKDEQPGSALFPTPNTMDHLPARTGDAYELNLRRGDPNGSRREMSGNIREVVINELLPTTAARDFKDGQADHIRDGKLQTDTIARAIFSGGEITSTAWGKFEPAIRRWENTLGTPAPPPTKPDGKDGAHRLSSEFTEWLMGMPAGWITGLGLSRNDELKACGNGVVPQQAVLALRMLTEGMQLPPAIDEGGGDS